MDAVLSTAPVAATPPPDPSARRWPALRPGIRESEQLGRDGRVFVLQHPESGRCFRLREVERFIAGALDGRHTAPTLAAMVRESFGIELAPERIAEFVAGLERAGLLVGGEGRPPAAPRWVRGELTYLRFPALDPDAMLARWLPWVAGLYSRGFLVASALGVLAALAVALAERAALGAGLAGLIRFDALLLAWAVVLITAAGHELAHGFACKRFGGRVREMGFMLIYLQPALYCNVSDAWLFPERRHRLAVTFAGAWFDLVLWALGVLAWRVADPDSGLAFVALVVVATAGFRVLFNLNPLIKLDGYYLLTDLLDAPNLQARAWQEVRAFGRRIAAWLDGPPPVAAPADAARPTDPPPHRRALVAYGVLATLYSSALLGAIAWWVGGALIERLDGLGAALAVGVTGVVGRQPLGALGRAIGDAGRGLAARWRAGRAPSPRALALLLGVLALLLMPAELTVSGALAIRPASNADVRAPFDGTLAEVLAAEGEQVVAGQPLARLASAALDQELAAAETRAATAATRLAEAERRVLDARRGDEARRRGARATALRADAEARLAEADLDRMAQLVAEGFVSESELASARARVAVRRGAAEEAAAARAAAEVGALGEAERERALAGVERDEAERALARLRELAGRALLRAPHAGVVTTPAFETRAGARVAVGDLVAEVHDLRWVDADIAVRERDIGVVRVGLPVEFKAVAHPDATFRGVVVAIAPATMDATLPGGGRQVRVTTRIENRDGLLRSGMTGHAKVACGTRPLAAVWARSLLGVLRVEVWSWW